MKRLLFAVIPIATCCALALAGEENPAILTITGQLYQASNDGKETPPPAPSRMNVGYWDKKNLKTTLVGKMEDGKVVAVSALGTARVNSDGTFSIPVSQKDVPQGTEFLGVFYKADGAPDMRPLKGANGEAVKIPTGKTTKIVDIGKIRVD